jgi:hypothetical protein
MSAAGIQLLKSGWALSVRAVRGLSKSRSISSRSVVSCVKGFHVDTSGRFHLINVIV